MGRRKIEIQPITHERNRSVTFLKRKNGLFKKAYELGVLCSVDVAVIIFEERPDHELKLHQYCSGDIRDIIQRQTKHQGDKDLRGPSDFSGAGSAKFEENADNDDDEEEEEVESQPVRSTRSRVVSKPTPSQKPAPKADPQTPASSRSAQPAPPSLQTEESSGASSFLPVSNDRGSSLRGSGTRGNAPNKRQRVAGAYNGSSGNSLSDEEGTSMKANAQAANVYLPERGTYDDRARQMNQMGATSMAHPPYHQPPPDAIYASTYAPQYGGGFPPHHHPPTNFVPMQHDFSSSRGGHHPPLTRDYSSDYEHTSRPRYGGSPYDSPMYGNMMRHPAVPPGTAQYPRQYMSREEGRGDMFSFLDSADQRVRGPTAPATSDLIWPIHNPRNGPNSAGSIQGRTEPAEGGSGEWLDFLSGNGAKPRDDLVSMFGAPGGDEAMSRDETTTQVSSGEIPASKSATGSPQADSSRESSRQEA